MKDLGNLYMKHATFITRFARHLLQFIISNDSLIVFMKIISLKITRQPLLKKLRTSRNFILQSVTEIKLLERLGIFSLKWGVYTCEVKWQDLFSFKDLWMSSIFCKIILYRCPKLQGIKSQFIFLIPYMLST